MSSLSFQLESLYYVSLMSNPKTAGFKKRSYDTIDRIWQRIKDNPEPTKTKEYESLSKSQKEKLDEFMATGIISVARLAEQDEKVVALRTLMGIYGIGPAKAIHLIGMGIRTIDDLKKRIDEPKLLTKAQKLGIVWYNDLHSRIPRKEIDSIHRWLSMNAPKTLQWRIVGSYRRGAATSGDVDILVTGDGRLELINMLMKQKIILHTLANGKKKFMGMAVLPGGKKMRHIDIIETTAEEFPFTSLYFTGSAEWNVKMRHHANKKGLRLNEHNYTHLKSGRDLTKVDYQELIGKDHPVSEEDVCAVIEWPYVEPSARI